MRRSDLAIAGGAGASLFALALAGGPAIGTGAVLGAALVAGVYLAPMAGLALMVLAGTALQTLGSEHITGLPLSLGKIAGAVTLLAWAARSAARRVPLSHSPQLLALAAFIAWLAVATLAAPDRALAVDGLFRYVQLALLFFMTASIAGESPRNLDRACLAVLTAMLLAALIGFAEFYVPSMSLESDDPSLVEGMVGSIIDRDSLDGVEVKRITGGMSDSNWLGYTLVGFLPLALYAFHRWRRPSARLAVLALAGLLGAAILLSFTRSALVAMAAAATVLLIRRRLPLLLAPAAGAAAALLVLVWNPAGIERVFSTEYSQAGSTPLRAMLLRGGAALIAERPLSGYGHSQYGPAFMTWLAGQPAGESVADWESNILKRVAAGEEQLEYIMPHNTVVQLWVEFGVIGVTAFAAFIWGIFRDLAVTRRFGSPHLGLLADCLAAGTTGFLVSALFGHLMLLKLVWILGGLAVAARRVALQETVP